jgi:para-aminobenzoate synthetase/4-amino-4-deoxychorismate lyase
MDFRLIETMRVCEDGTVFLLDRHLARLMKSSRHFSFRCDLDRIRGSLLKAAVRHGQPACLRLTLSVDGSADIETAPLPAGYVQRVKLSSVRVQSDDVFLYHKTTNRGLYERARSECDERMDAILINERGEITETSIMNIAVFRNSRWITPQTSCGLLPGVMREELLARGEIIEGVIRAEELINGEHVRCFNALRGVFTPILEIGTVPVVRV